MSEWTIEYSDWDPDQEPLREALCALGNGYIVTRGAAEELPAGGPHYPGTYLAGGYDRLGSEVAGKLIENEDLVNWPNWLALTFRHEGGPWFAVDDVQIQDYRQTLDMQRGLLSRRLRFRDSEGRETTLECRRIVSMADPHLAAIQWKLRPENWSGEVELRSALDGTVTNSGVERYGALNGNHLESLSTHLVGEDAICLHVRTRQSHIRMAQAARTRLFVDDSPLAARRETSERDGYIAQHLRFHAERHHTVRIEKIVTIYTSRDFAVSEERHEASKEVLRAADFDPIRETQTRSWRHLWQRCDMALRDGSDIAQQVLRLHIFHLLQTASMNTIGLDVGIPSRGWHGEAYRGHILWDELFIFPFLNFRLPELTRSLLMYRCRRLDEARHLAAEADCKGAMYPWQSGSDGREESQKIHLNPASGEWIPDNTNLQRHVNAAIAYNAWRYYQASGDFEFLSFYGAEMILEIARFLASLATLNPQRDRYEIRNVVGPDEFHTRYPDSDEPGLNNNAYTNVMAAWVLRCAGIVLDLLSEDRRGQLLEDLQIDGEERARWERISRRMFVPFHEGGIISQFEGYEKLQEFDWEGYRKKYGNIQRLDRLLEAEGDDVNRYKAGKQADVLMLFYLFSTEELQKLMSWMGYGFDPKLIPANVRYYQQRTSHGSTLSRVVYAWVMARADRERSWSLFEKALSSDYQDIQGGTTPEGIHLGAMAGTVDILQRCYTGIEVREDVLWFNPAFPRELHCIQLRVRYRGHWIGIHATHEELTISFEHGWSPEVQLGVQGEVYTFRPGDSKTFKLKDG